MKKTIIYGASMLIIGIVIGWLCRTSLQDKTEVVQRDTLVFRDTIKEYHPIEIRKEIVDTMLVFIRDTIRIKDTLYLTIPLERKIYASDEYYAEVSGYRPSLDYIEVFPKTKIITEKITFEPAKNNIGIGIEAGYVNAFSIPIYLEYTRMLHKNIEIYGQMIYDLPTKQWGAGIGAKVSLSW